MSPIDIYIIILLFLIGITLGISYTIIGLNLPIKQNKIDLCNKCNKEYKWYQLIPFIIHIKYKGKCPNCHNKISIAYPILQITTGILFSLSYILYGFSYEMISMIIMISLSIIIYITDFNYYIILDSPILIFSILILIFKLIFFGAKTFVISLISGFLIFLFMFLVGLLGKVIFKKDSLGGGDIKLASFFGFTLGVRLGIISLILGSLLAFPQALYYSISPSNKNREIPFGPYLISGLLLVFLFMDPIRSFLSILFI